jgi:hypothetical protein
VGVVVVVVLWFVTGVGVDDGGSRTEERLGWERAAI